MSAFTDEYMNSDTLCPRPELITSECDDLGMALRAVAWGGRTVHVDTRMSFSAPLFRTLLSTQLDASDHVAGQLSIELTVGIPECTSLACVGATQGVDVRYLIPVKTLIRAECSGLTRSAAQTLTKHIAKELLEGAMEDLSRRVYEGAPPDKLSIFMSQGIQEALDRMQNKTSYDVSHHLVTKHPTAGDFLVMSPEPFQLNTTDPELLLPAQPARLKGQGDW